MRTQDEPEVVVSARIERGHREALEAIAARDDRTLSYLVRRAVGDYLRRSAEGGASPAAGASPERDTR